MANPGGPFSPEHSFAFWIAVPTVANRPSGSQIDATIVAGDYRETDALGDPALGPGLAPVDPLLGLAAFGAQLAEFMAGLQAVLVELQARTALLQG